jgi:hypothetical protein
MIFGFGCCERFLGMSRRESPKFWSDLYHMNKMKGSEVCAELEGFAATGLMTQSTREACKEAVSVLRQIRDSILLSGLPEDAVAEVLERNIGEWWNGEVR